MAIDLAEHGSGCLRPVGSLGQQRQRAVQVGILHCDGSDVAAPEILDRVLGSRIDPAGSSGRRQLQHRPLESPCALELFQRQACTLLGCVRRIQPHVHPERRGPRLPEEGAEVCSVRPTGNETPSLATQLLPGDQGFRTSGLFGPRWTGQVVFDDCVELLERLIRSPEQKAEEHAVDRRPEQRHRKCDAHQLRNARRNVACEVTRQEPERAAEDPRQPQQYRKHQGGNGPHDCGPQPDGLLHSHQGAQRVLPGGRLPEERDRNQGTQRRPGNGKHTGHAPRGKRQLQVLPQRQSGDAEAITDRERHPGQQALDDPGPGQQRR